MKKTFSLVGLAIAFLLVAGGAVFAGGSAEKQASSAGSSQNVRGKTITVMFASPAPPQVLLNQLKEKTGVSVNWVNLGVPAEFTKIAAASAANTYFADVTDVDWSRVGELAKTNWYFPLNKYFDVAALKKDMPQLSTFIDKEGQVVGLPVDTSSLVTTVNTADFKKAGITEMPKTIAQYTEDLKQIRSSGVNPHPLGIGLAAVPGLPLVWFELAAIFGGNVLNKNLQPTFTDPQSPGYRSLAWVVSLYKSGIIVPGDVNVRFAQEGSKNVATHVISTDLVDSSGNIATIYDVPADSKVVGQVQYIPTPGLNGPAPNLGDPDGMGIPRTAKYPAAAVAFLKWLTSTQVQTDISGGGKADLVVEGWPLPDRLSSMQVLAQKHRQTNALIGIIKKYSSPIFPQGSPPWYPKFEYAAETNLNAAIAGTETVAQAIQSIANTVNSQNQ